MSVFCIGLVLEHFKTLGEVVFWTLNSEVTRMTI